MIDLSPRHLAIVESILAEHVPACEVCAFGSRATWTASDHSDLDLAVVGKSPLDPATSADLKEAFEESDLPMRVDVLDWHRVSKAFQEVIEAEMVVLQGKGKLQAGDSARRLVKSNWSTMPFTEAFLVNPPVSIEQGTPTPFVDMAAIDPSRRTVCATSVRKFRGGGSRFSNGDTLLARVTPSLENGKIARYCANSDGDVAHGSTEFIVVRGRPGVTDNDYAFYATRSDVVRNYAIGQMTGTSGRQRVPIESLAHLYIGVPTIPEQCAIAHILGTLDDKIELNRRMNKTLEAIAQTLFKSWFVDFDPVRAKMKGRGTGFPQDITDLFPDRLVDSEIGEIPEGWTVIPLDRVARFQGGLALQRFHPAQTEARLPVAKITQMRAGEANSGKWTHATIRPEYVVQDGDVLFSWSGSLLVKIWSGGRAALNQHLFKVTSERCPKWFFLHSLLLHLPTFRRIAQDKTMTKGHIRRHHLTEALCVVPPDAVMAGVSDIFRYLLERRVINELTRRTLAALRDMLLPALISGELRLEKATENVQRYHSGPDSPNTGECQRRKSPE